MACFDTSFHTSIPGLAQQFAIPRKLTEEGIRRYGFHGLSYEYISKKLPEYDQKAANGKSIVAHLGSGASMCAMKNSKSIASTLGFTALDGLVMGTRTGLIDPGVVLYLMQNKGMNDKDIEKLLYKESGLLGISGISNDMRVLLKSDKQSAKEAISIFVYRIKREIGSLMAAIEGLDAIVFTAGIGEKSSEIREMICKELIWLGVKLDKTANLGNKSLISTSDSKINIWVIPTNEELMIAEHTRDILMAS